jgi:hypothetical protein
MRMPSHTALCSFVFSMILTSALIPSAGDASLASAGSSAAQLAVQSALNGLRSEGFAGSSQLALPAPAASPMASAPATASSPGPVLTSDLMGKILKAIQLFGGDKNADAGIASALGLTAPGQTWPDRQLGSQLDNETAMHGFVISRGSEQDVMIYLSTGDTALIFRSTRDGKVVAALNRNKKTRQITMLNPREAQAALNTEIAYWAANIDDILAGK